MGRTLPVWHGIKKMYHKGAKSFNTIKAKIWLKTHFILAFAIRLDWALRTPETSEGQKCSGGMREYPCLLSPYLPLRNPELHGRPLSTALHLSYLPDPVSTNASSTNQGSWSRPKGLSPFPAFQQSQPVQYKALWSSCAGDSLTIEGSFTNGG